MRLTVFVFFAGLFIACTAEASSETISTFDPTGRVSVDGVYTPPSLAELENAFDEAVSYSADPRIQSWAALARESKHDALIAAALEDLESADPHPFASHVWSWAHWAGGRYTSETLPPVPERLPDALRKQLELAARVFANARSDQPEKSIALLPELLALENIDYWATVEARYHADDLGYSELVATVDTRLMRAFPNDFGVAWMAQPEGEGDLVEAARLLDANPDVDQAPVGRFVRWAMAHRNTSPATWREVVELWNRAAPGDVNVLRRLGYQHRELNRYAAAQTVFREAHAAYPFRDAWARTGDMSARLGDFDAADRVVRDSVDYDEPAERREVELQRRLATVYREAGEHGRARAAALRARELAPDDDRIVYQLAVITWWEDRDQEALEIVEPVFQRRPGDATVASFYFQRLKEAKHYARVHAAYKRFEEAGGRAKISMLRNVLDSFVQQERYEEAASFYAAIEADRSPDAWMMQSAMTALENLDRHAEAARLSVESVKLYQYSSFVTRMVQALKTAGRENEVSSILGDLKQRFPFNVNLWAGLIANGEEAMSVWQEAEAKNPKAAFPIHKTASALLGTESQHLWPEADKIVEAGIARLKGNGADGSEIAKLLEHRAEHIDRAWYNRVQRDPELMKKGQEYLDEARSLGLSDGSYFDQMRFILSRLGASEELVRVSIRWAELNLDNQYLIGRLFDLGEVRGFNVSALRFRFLNRYVDRRPRDPARLDDAAHRHNKWGGSPVVALAHLEQLKKWNPGEDVKRENDYAYNRLGSSKWYFHNRYNKGTNIGSSERFIGWYEAERAAARKLDPTIKSLDLENMAVVLIRPDGIEEERGYHPVRGNLVYYRIGAATLQVDYTDTLQFAGISIGSKKLIEIEYDEPAFRGFGQSISAIRSENLPEMRFEHNEQHRPIMMHAVGLGVLHVTYDETGEINSVKTENEPGATDTDVPGIEISTAVTRVMQNLTRLTGIVGDVQEGSFDALFEEDEALAALRARARLGHVAEPTMPALLQRRIDLASELIRRIADHPDHQRQADQLLRNQLDGVVSDDKWSAAALASASDKTDRAAAIEKMIELAGLWHRVNTIMRPEGLPLDLWNEWIGTLEWIGSHDEASDAPAVRTAIANFNAQVLKEPPRLLSSAGWLNSSALSNPGYWSNYAKNVVIPKALAPEARLTAILVRRNGHVVVGSNVGFAVMRRGFWEWFGFDPAQQRFSRSMDTGDVGPGSFITSLAEDSQGRLWLGQSNGIALISADYELQPRVWRSGNDGLIQGRVESLEINGNALAVGGDSGLALFDLKTLSAHIVSAKAVRSIRMAADGFLIIGRNTLRVLRGGEEVPLTDFRVVDAFYHPDERQLFVIQGEKVLKRNLTGLTADEPIEIEPFRLVYGQEAIEHTAPPTGFAYMQVLDDEKALGVLTDQGVSFYRRNTFEHLTLPGGNRRKGIEQMAVRDGRAYFITSTGIAAHEAGQARLAISGRVYDVLTDPEIGFTFAATGYGIEAINHNDDEPVAQRFSGDAARFLKLAPDGALVTHDGNTILRYQRGSNTAQELFSAAEQTLAGEFKRGNIEDIMVQSDGTVWVVAGASLFRWKSKEDFEEFSIFKDERRFPVNSQWLSKIVETVDGRILLVASNEGHVTHSGVSLAGGLFEYVDGAFEKSSLDESIGNWFLTSYTPIDDEWAIAGSLGGFSIQKGNRLEDYDELKEASYMAVRQNRPALYLGTRGAKIGDKTWLFGSASGVIGYHDGRWFDPDRLNWMLPAQDFADYGSRVVHAVESDAKGRIYVATDWGLTVYDPLGAGPEKFLISERLGNFAFANVEKQRMGQVNDVLSDAIPDTGKGAKLAKSLENSRKQIALLEERIANAETVQTEDEKQLTKKIRRARQKEIALLAKLEHEYPVLFNMLQLNPLDLHAVASKLPDGVKVAQYLPTDRVLYINLVSNLGTEIREIRVDRAELEAATVKAAQLLAAQALGMVRGGLNFAVSDAGKSVGDAVSEAARRAQNAELNKTLAWLYDQLLRPIEHEISADETLVVSPVGVLSYIPYGALVSNIEENKVSYAVERFHFATAPSLYSVDRLSEHRESLASSHLVFGDPDGSLPAARQEASDIAEVLADDIVELRIGEEATYDELVQGAEDARFIHLAMHGKLDARSPRDSYLLLADDQRMSLPQIMTLPLQDADLVFLSACETGIGTDGLEYRTIAHAFAHAGAPTVIATLWQVDDAATRELAVAFYAAKVDGESKSRALASAQRAMLSGGGTYALPGYWAGFTIFGRP